MKCSRENAVIHRSWQHFKMKFIWRYGKELCYTLEFIQTLHTRNDKERCVDFYNSEAKMCLFFTSFRAPPVALKQKSKHNFKNMLPIVTSFQGLFKFMKRHILVIFSKQLNVFSRCYQHASFFLFLILNKFPVTYALDMCVKYDKTK